MIKRGWATIGIALLLIGCGKFGTEEPAQEADVITRLITADHAACDPTPPETRECDEAKAEFQNWMNDNRGKLITKWVCEVADARDALTVPPANIHCVEPGQETTDHALYLVSPNDGAPAFAVQRLYEGDTIEFSGSLDFIAWSLGWNPRITLKSLNVVKKNAS